MKNKKFLKVWAALANAGHTLGDLAEELNLSLSSLSGKINGKTSFTLEEITTACKFLNAPVDIFFD